MMVQGIRVDENGIMLRPIKSDEIVRRRAAELALPAVKSCRYGIGTDAEIIESLMPHIGGVDGYEIVKSLEFDGWTGDSMLVEVMDQDFISQALKELVSQWERCVGGGKCQVPVTHP